jgi:hypothetical protein
MLRLACPSCRKDSYSASAEAFNPCPYCGIVYSGKHGIERRNEDRFDKPVDMTFSYKGADLQVTPLNVSGKGLTVKISSPPVLPIGDLMDIQWRNSNLRARIMWVMKEPYSSLTGLKILNEGISLVD